MTETSPERAPPSQTPDDPGWTARRLLRAARVGTLATQSGGYPFAGLVTPATTPELSVLLLLSDLSEHTKQLRRDPRCALLVAGPAAEGNPQTTPRVTVSGSAAIADEAGLRARFLAVHPYAGLYAGFGDFYLWRIAPEELAAGRRLRKRAPAAPRPAAARAGGGRRGCSGGGRHHGPLQRRPRGHAGAAGRRVRRMADGGRGRRRLRPGPL